MTTLTSEQHTALLDALDALDDRAAAALTRGDVEGAKHFHKQWQTLHSLISDSKIKEAK